MKQRKLIAYAALLLVPTLAIGLAAMRLLRHEQDRLQRLARVSLEERLQTAAAEITQAVREAEGSLMRQLMALPEAELGKALRAWQATDPLVRHVFIYGTSRTVDQHIAQLRKKIEPDPGTPTVLTTVHGAGYRYEGEAV